MTGDRSQRHLRSALVIAEVAMALMLVSGTGLLLRSFVNLLHVDTGFNRDNVMVMQMFAWDRNPGPAALRSFHDRVTAKVASIPGVQQVGVVQAMPFIESNIDIQEQMRLIDQPPPQPGEEIRASYNVAIAAAISTAMGVRPLAGPPARPIATARPRRGSVVISEAFAERYLRNIDPVGQRLEIRAQGKPVQIGDRRRRAVAAARAPRRCAARRGAVPVCASADRLDHAGRPHQRRSGDADRDDQARDLDDRSDADLLPHGDARGAGRSDARSRGGSR